MGVTQWLVLSPHRKAILVWIPALDLVCVCVCFLSLSKNLHRSVEQESSALMCVCLCLFTFLHWRQHHVSAAADPKQGHVGTSEVEQIYVSAFKKMKNQTISAKAACPVISPGIVTYPWCFWLLYNTCHFISPQQKRAALQNASFDFQRQQKLQGVIV